MIRWAWRNLLAEPASLLLSGVGLAVALLLVVFLEGVFRGEADRIVAYLTKAGADVWVMQAGVSNMHMATSILPDGALAEVGEVDGVAGVTPIVYIPVMLEAGDNPAQFAYAVGLPGDARRGLPWRIVAGKRRPAPGEVVAPQVLVRTAGLGLGDTIAISDRRFRITGLSAGTFSMANTLIFLHWDDAADLAGSLNANYALVAARPGTPPRDLAKRIRESVDGVAAYDVDAFVRNDRGIAIQMGGELILLMTFIGAVVGALIVAWTIFAFVARRRRELAVAKAVGAANRQVVAGVIFQSCILALLGYAIAVGAAFPLQALLERAAPEVAVHITGVGLLRIGAVTLAVALVAGLVPIRRVLQVDPTTVFSG